MEAHPTGKSLGAHIPSHLILNPSFKKQKEIQSDCSFLRNKRQRKWSLHSSPEYGALCLMLLSRDLVSVSDETDLRRSESDILRIGIDKAGSFSSVSGFGDAEFKKDANFIALLKSLKKKKGKGFKRSKYECTICSKSFHSYQALGGHCASHRKIRPDSSSVPTEQQGSQKFRAYECPICEKIFASGQALGGHKRSHLLTGCSEASSPEKKITSLGMLDLNLPVADCTIYQSFDSSRNLEEARLGA